MREQAAQESADLAAQWTALIEQLPCGVTVVDAAGRIVLTNEAGRLMRGAPPGEARTLAERLQTYLPREASTGRLLALEETPLGRALAGEVVDGYELTFCQAGSAAATWLQAAARPLVDGAGTIIGAVTVFWDVTRERRLKHALEVSEERLRVLYDAVTCGILVRDAQGHVVRANRAAEAIFGVPLQEMRRDAVEIWPAIAEDGTPLAVSEYPMMVALRTGKPVRGVTVGFKRPRAATLWIQLDAVPALAPNGTVVEVVSSFIDITARKQAEDLLAMRARQQAAVAGLGQQALTGTSLGALMEEAAAVVAGTLGVEYSQVLEMLPAGEEVLRAGHGWREGHAGQPCPVGGASQAGYTLGTGAPLVVEDMREETRFGGPALWHEHGVVSGLSVIIPGRPAPYGVLSTHTTRRRTFTQDDIHFLQSVANVLAAASERDRAETERRRAYEAAQARAARLHTLVDTGKELVGARSLEYLLTQGLQQAAALSGFAQGRVLLMTGAAGTARGTLVERVSLVPAAPRDIDRPPYGGGAVSSATGASDDAHARTALHEGRVLVHQHGTDAAGAAPGAGDSGATTLYVPLVTPGGRPLGVLILHGATRSHLPQAHDLDALQLLGDYLAGVIEATELQERLGYTVRALLAVHDAGRRLGASLSMEEVGGTLLQIAMDECGMEVGLIRLRSARGRWRVWHTAGPAEVWHAATGARGVRAARRVAMQTGTLQFVQARRGGGAPAALPGWLVPLRAHDRVVGLFEAYGAKLARQSTGQVLGSLANQAAGVLENVRLYRELADREQRLQDLVAHLLLAQEEDRRRVAYEVHDGLTQIATATHLHLQALASRYRPRSAQAREELDRALHLAQNTIREARRVIAGLRPTTLDDFGLQTAVRLQVEELRAAGWSVVYEEDLGAARLPRAVETALFRVAQEALENVRKHAHATRVQVTLRRKDGSLHLEVRDWGRGFRPALARGRATPGERVGLLGIQERISLLGGRCSVRSRPGAGTRIVVDVPLGQEGGERHAVP